LFFYFQDGSRQPVNARSRQIVGPQTWALAWALILILGAMPSALAEAPPSVAAGSGTAPVLIVGFMGGFVHANDFRHSEAQIALRLAKAYGDRVQIQVFENRQRAKAHQWILGRLAATQNASAVTEDPSKVRIFLFGHSWGASAAVYLARQLERDRVPVSLTVQVDSISKNGRDDSVIPANVAEAMNFYQTQGWLHGRPAITAADPLRTKILGNIRLTYEKAPPECRAYPWYDRLLFKGHTAIECDPRVWSEVERLIQLRLPELRQSAPNLVATGVAP
jgi:hypothetical protein